MPRYLDRTGPTSQQRVPLGFPAQPDKPCLMGKLWGPQAPQGHLLLRCQSAPVTGFCREGGVRRVGHQGSRGPQTHDLPRLPLGRRPSPTEARADSRQANGLSAIVHTRLHSSPRRDYPQPESHLSTEGVFPVLGGRLTSECRSDHTGSLWVERPGEDTCPVLGDLRAVAAGVWASSLNVRGPSPFLKKQLPPREGSWHRARE